MSRNLFSGWLSSQAHNRVFTDKEYVFRVGLCRFRVGFGTPGPRLGYKQVVGLPKPKEAFPLEEKRTLLSLLKAPKNAKPTLKPQRQLP